MSKHTPGPWEVASQFVGPLVVRPVGGTEPVALVGHESWETCQANAHVIAAVPDMLDVLERAHAFIDDQSDVLDGDYGAPHPNRAMILASAIDEVLRKARGEA